MITLNFPFRCISKDNEKIFNSRGRPFLSRKYKDFALAVQRSAQRQYGGLPLAGRLRADFTFIFTSKVHSDLTNCPKGVCDSLNGLIWNDDRQIKACQMLVIENAEEDSFIVSVQEL